MAGALVPIEIKSAATFAPDFLKGIDHFEALVGDRCEPGLVLYNGQEQYTLKGTRVINPMIHEGIEAL
jgi:uncharacterized protein